MNISPRHLARPMALFAVALSVLAPSTSVLAQIHSAPAEVILQEDTPQTFDFLVSNPALYRNVNISGATPGLFSSLQIQLVGSSFFENRYRIFMGPAANFSGTGFIDVFATDGFILDSSARIRVTIQAVDDPPTASMAALSSPEDVPAVGTATLADVDTAISSASFSIVSSSDTSLVPVENVTITGSGATRTVTVRPVSNRSGTATLTFRAFDTANSARASNLQVPVTFTAVNDAPVAGPAVTAEFAGGLGSSGGAGLQLSNAGIPANTPDAPHAIEAWVRPTGAVARQWLLQLGHGGPGSHHWLLETPQGSSTVTLVVGVWNGAQTRVQLPIDTWTHVATTYDGDIYEVFLNGIRAGSANVDRFNLSPDLATPAHLALGRSYFNNELHFRGQVDELRLWNRALTAREILARFRTPRTGDVAVDPADNGLLVYWRLDENHGTTAFDSAPLGGRQNGTLLNGASWRTPIRRDLYDGIPNRFLSTLYADPRYPASPSSVTYLADAFETPPNSGNFYGQRLSGHIVAPTTGDYTFYIASDDQSELLLSTDDDPANKRSIARVDAWTTFRNWTQFASQRSAAIRLEAGRRYYLEANMVEADGLDNLSVRWDLPGGAVEAPIPASRFDAGDHFGPWNVAEDEPTKLYLTATDFEVLQAEASATLDFTIVEGPQHGTLDPPTGGRWTNPLQNPILYTPSLDYNGPDSFTFTVRDQAGLVSPPSRVRINVIGANDLPDISPIADLTIIEGESSGPIPFTITDTDTPTADVLVTVESSDTTLVPLDRITLAGSGSNRSIEIRPAPGELGTLTITLTAFDGDIDGRTKQEAFKIRVDPRPAYALVDLGDLGQRNQSFGRSVNDSGWAAAFAQSQNGDARAALFRGLSSSALLENLTPTGASLSRAFGINAHNVVVGTRTPDASSPAEAFVWRDDTLTSLRTTLQPGVHSVANAINDNGDIVGSLRIASDPRQAFLLLDIGTKTNLTGFGGTNAGGEAINNRGMIAGWATDAAKKAHPFTFSLAAGMNRLAELTGHDSGHAYGINDDGLVVGDSYLDSDPQATVRAFLREGSTTVDLGTLEGGTNSIAYAINNFRQIVGEANDSQGRRRAYLRTAERNFDLNDLIHDSRMLRFEDGAWSLEEARSISRNGTIVGAGRFSGRYRAFMAVPAWVIGRQIARPEDTVPRQPEIELIDASEGDTKENAFYWSTKESKLYPIRPVTARIKWFKSFRDVLGSGTNLTVNTDRVEIVGVSVWPKDPQIHVATAPVEIEPAAAPDFRYGFQNVLFHTGTLPTVDPTTKTYNKTDRGYSVLYYLETGSVLPRTPNPSTQRPYFEVVRTRLVADLLVVSNAVIGTKISDPAHLDYAKKNGYVLNEVSPYDGAGTERAYDRPTRMGPILPVNLDTAAATDDLVVVWYRINRIGVAWANRPVKYSLSWPTDTAVSRIVIASSKGSGPLFNADFPSRRVYNQPDPGLPGYNPNEEHAMLKPSADGAGEALFALRNDLNALLSPPASLPYALLKYRDPVTTDWCIKPFKVLADQP
ncbi:MAG: DUF3466 family protein, partial [Verrucomicrobiales bacterium]|nr:DUF3466 family protein [Verrucomicrobiales bacterium]